ncbi:peptide chain release factor N(5)-glutamine methyltransferase [Sphingomonas sp. FW199]|uniref:peptide chain release factor N(5)-glutamine methyltransferase n=1 Tax=Sphingomonas sp. FW199 TaxID=3400217 RepID=UPI003CF461B2
MTVRAALAAATARLGAISDTARLDAELLMAHALGVSRSDVMLRHLDEAAPDAFDALIERRMALEPVAYITGTRDFWTITLAVGPGVLIPRPDSETLIEAAVERFSGGPGPRHILDLGTGPGTLLLAALAEWPEATGIGVDVSEAALAFARANGARIAPDRAAWRLGNWTDGIEGTFDLILCNPPYIGTGEAIGAEVRAHEPAGALFAGTDGLDAYRRIIPELSRLLAPGGAAVLEIGWTQGDAVAAMIRDAGMTPAMRRDLAGRPRAIIGN